ncbi:hypothetical protein EUTSA_v10009819mg [Eutrema salsugineum]|uniref:BHLH domain-containing protein n=1 Tax=Eutrema salsugineum TaxID=72664 RepID=V4L7Q4_EUTSA|nr:hypothetical protein EUTSA_v10009819mg [Eutrema salsugineum]
MEREISGEGSSLSLRKQRNLREKDRRMHMKHLFYLLSSHVSPTHRLPVPQLIDQATSYMIQLKEKIKYLKEKKKALLGEVENHSEGSYLLPQLTFNSWDSTIQMNLIMDANMKRVMLHELVSVFQEEGAQAIIFRIGIDPSRIEERVRSIIF